MIDLIKKVYYTCTNVLDEAQLSFYSGIIPEYQDNISYFPVSEEVEQIAREFDISIIPTDNKAFFIEGKCYRIAWYESYTYERCAVLVRASEELVKTEDSFIVDTYSAKVEIEFGIGRNRLLYNKKDECVYDDFSAWLQEWEFEIKELIAALCEVESFM